MTKMAGSDGPITVVLNKYRFTGKALDDETRIRDYDEEITAESAEDATRGLLRALRLGRGWVPLTAGAGDGSRAPKGGPLIPVTPAPGENGYFLLQQGEDGCAWLDAGTVRLKIRADLSRNLLQISAHPLTGEEDEPLGLLEIPFCTAAAAARRAVLVQT